MVLLVGMYSNTSGVVTGITLNGRTANVPGIEHIVGPTIVTVPFRTRYQPDQPVNELLKKIQERYIDMVPYEQLGLQNIKRLSVEAEAACDFRSLLVIQSTKESNRTRSGGELLSLKQDLSIILDYPLTMECELHDTSIKLRARFDKNLLSVSQVQKICRHFEYLLHQLCSENPGTRVSDVQTSCPADMMEVVKWNATPPKAFTACIHNLIQQRICNQNFKQFALGMVG